jgi:phage major head subunit gpT-like protein
LQRTVTQALVEALRTGWNAAFQRGLKSATPMADILATPISSTTKTETYGWMGSLPIFRKWVGEKRIKTIEEMVYQLINDAYEATGGVHKHQIADDNLGLIAPAFAKWGSDSKMWKDRLLFDALAQGHTRPCYDNQYFFDSDHPTYRDDGSTYSNIDTSNVGEAWYLVDLSSEIKPLIFQEREAPHFWMITDPMDSEVAKTGIFGAYAEARGAAGYTFPQLAFRSTAALNIANYIAARDAMEAFTDHNGEPLEVKATHIVVGRSNKQKAIDIFKKANLVGGESNTLNAEVEIIYARRLP